MPVVSIVGGETPLGSDLADVLKERKLPAGVQLLGAAEESGALLTELEGEATVLTPLDAERVRQSDLVFCCTAARRTRDLPGGSGTLIDLTYALEDDPRARLWSGLKPPESAPIYVLAHPAASALASMLRPLHEAHPIRHAVVQVFEPASERGKAGVIELQQQVTSLLSFRKLDKTVFDAQTAFNMLPRYGEDAPEQLAAVENRVERHLATLLEGRVPLPSVRVIHAPVFHGHSFLMWVEFESRPDAEDVSAAIESDRTEVRDSSVEPPTNVATAGQSGTVAGMIEADRNHPRATWIWAAADNYRMLADSAADLAAHLLGVGRH